MKILDILRAVKDALIGKEFYEDEGYSTSQLQEGDLDFNSDLSEDGEEYEQEEGENDGSISAEDLSTFETALRQFYSHLSQTEMEDPDLDKMTDEIQECFFEGRIKDPERALNDVYRKWKSTREERKQKRSEARDKIIEMLRRYDMLTEAEKYALTDWESPLYLGNLKKNDSKAVEDVVKSWYNDKVIDDDKCRLFNDISSSDAEEWFPYYSISETPLEEADYRQLIVLYNYDTWTQGLHYKDLAEYCKSYWLHSGNKPQPIATDDLLVNRPCYMISNLKLCTPRFHLGKRFFEDEDSFQNVKVYLFADKLEYLGDGGHIDIYIKDIIDISLNDWGQIAFRWEQIRDWQENEHYGSGNTEPCPNVPEPELLEITCRNSNKLLFTYSGNNSELLILRALMFYFIKNPQ